MNDKSNIVTCSFVLDIDTYNTYNAYKSIIVDNLLLAQENS